MARILIVDDSIYMRQVLGKILKAAGHHVVGEADSAESAYQQMTKLQPDLITLDLVMPGEGGLGLLVRLDGQKDRPKVIVVSAVGQEQQIETALGLGAADFIVKPFDAGTIQQTIAGLVAPTA